MHPRYVDKRGLTIIPDRVVHDYEIPEEPGIISRVARAIGKGALYGLKRLPATIFVCFGMVMTLVALAFKIAAVLLRLPFALLGSGGNVSTALICSALDDS